MRATSSCALRPGHVRHCQQLHEQQRRCSAAVCGAAVKPGQASNAPKSCQCEVGTPAASWQHCQAYSSSTTAPQHHRTTAGQATPLTPATPPVAPACPSSRPAAAPARPCHRWRPHGAAQPARPPPGGAGQCGQQQSAVSTSSHRQQPVCLAHMTQCSQQQSEHSGATEF